MPKSVRFAGVAIITVYGTELISRATGTSSGSCQVTGVRLPLACMETPSAGTEQSTAAMLCRIYSFIVLLSVQRP